MESDILATGVAIFQSVNALNQKTQSRRDDIISLIYSLIYLVSGVSFWAFEILANDRALQNEKITKFKNLASEGEFCKGEATCFYEVLKMSYALSYEEEPKYKDIISLLIHEILKLDRVPDENNYDWGNKQFFLRQL